MTSEGESGISKTAKNVILKGDRSFDAFVSRLCEKFKMFWTPKESWYLKEPIGVKYDLIKGLRNVHKCQKVTIKRYSSFDSLFSRFWEKFQVFWIQKKSGYLTEPVGVKYEVDT